ncbi:MAG: sulfite exporter TauE/SafE family protein [Pseudomonadota bacterium]|nr:sulfite exporter TauE/SafE family protein [Pseudomonadota bacterium]
MELFISLLTDGTTLNFAGFSALCGISFVGSFIAAGLGLGGGLLVLATMTLFLPPTVLIPVHAVVQIGSNGFRAFLMRRQILYSVIPAFLVGTLLGSWLGGLTIFALEVWLLQSILGVFVLYATWAPKFRSSNPGPMKFFGCGVFGGFATMFVGGTGPLVAPFVNAACQERQQVVATHASLMTFQHLFKVILFGVLGFAFGPYIPLMVGLIGFGVCGTIIGRRVLDRLPEKTFRIALQTILTLLAARLLYAAWTNYFA